MFLVIKRLSRPTLHLIEGRPRILNIPSLRTRDFSRKGKDDDQDGKGSKKKPKGKAPNQGFWDDTYDTEEKFGKKVESDWERLTKMAEKEADPKDMDVTSRIEGEARPSRTWVGVNTGPPKGKKGRKDEEE